MEEKQFITSGIVGNDPSSLTTQQLWREIASLKELLLTRIAAIEKDIDKSHEDAVRVPTEIQKQVGAIRELLEEKIENTNRLKEEKFKKVEQRFELIEHQRIEQKSDSSEAVKAEVQSTRELFTLQNSSFTKQIDQMQIFIQSDVKSLDDKIDDNKNKIIRLESMAAGVITEKMDHRGVVQERQTSTMNTASIISIVIGGAIGLVGIIMTILSYINK